MSTAPLLQGCSDGGRNIGLPIAPSTYHPHVARRADPTTAPPRVRPDAELRRHIRRVGEESFEVYGVRKISRQLARHGIAVARCTVVRLMREMGLEGAVRGRIRRTMVSDTAKPCPHDRVNRVFRAEHRFPVVIATSSFGMLRRPLEAAQDVSITHTQRLAEAGIEPSVGSVGDS